MRRFALIPLSLTLPLILAPSTHAAGSRILRGTVLDYSTTPHHVVAGVAVSVQIQRNGQPLASIRGRTDGHGRFALAVPVAVNGASYAVVARYRGVSYETDVTPAQAARSVQAPVYDTTSKDTGVIAPSVVIGARRVGSGLAVIEQWTFVNAGTLTDVGAGPATGRGSATFLPPNGATHLAILAKGSLAATATVQGGTVVVNSVLRPATGLNAASFHQVTFTFDVPGGAGHPTLLIPTPYLIGSLKVFTVGSRLFAPGFKQTTLQDGGRAVPAWEAEKVAPGSTLAVGVDGPPVVATVAAGPAPFPDALVGAVVGAGFAGLLLLGLLGRVRMGRAPRDVEALRRERARLVAAIAELDLRHARGEMPQDRYEQRRLEQKSQLLRVARQLGG